MILKEFDRQRESFHGNIWKLRGIDINVISLKLTFRGLLSGNLVINEKTKSLEYEDLSWIYEVWNI